MIEHGLSDAARAVLAEIVEGPGATAAMPGPCWSPRARLELIASPQEVDGLVEAGWLEPWAGIIGGPAVTLTPLAASRLGVRLEEFDTDETPCWVPHDHPERSVVIRRERGFGPLPYPDLEVDTRARQPIEYLIDEEWSSEPVTLWGQLVPIDPRVRGKRAS